MITIYAEKFDVAAKIAAALGGFAYNGKHINMSNISKYKTGLDKDVKKNGYIMTNFEGNDYAITWGQGHMCGLFQASDYDPEYALWSNIPLPFIPKEYKIKIREGYDYKNKKKTKEPDKWAIKQLAIINNLFKKSEYIINATDDDREGELIFAYVYQHLKCNKPYKRMVMDSQTEPGLLKAFRNLKDSSKVLNIESAGRARSIADWVVGANISAKMTLKYSRAFPSLKMITAGRIQTVILDFIVTREKAIREFKSEKFYYIDALFNKDDQSYLGKHSERQIMDKLVAENLLKKVDGHSGEVTKKETAPFKKDVPLLYNLTNLSKDINTLYGYTAAETLSICQSLYEKGYTTYPRTESTCLTDDMKGEVDLVLDMLASYNTEYAKLINGVKKRNYSNRHFNSKKVESHFAIIPTHEAPKSMTEKEEKVYNIIARSLIRIIYGPAIGEKTSIETTVSGEIFKTNGIVITDPQWMLTSVNYGKRQDDEIPKIEVGDIVDGKYSLKEGETRPPARYTDASLLLAMQTASKEIEDSKLKKILETSNKGGIGRPSTQASLIESVVQRYCTRKGKTIIPTDSAMIIIDILPIEDLKSPEMTAKWEEDLDKIAKGAMKKEDFINDIESSVIKWCKEIDDAKNLDYKNVDNKDKSTDLTCPICGKPLLKHSSGYGCSGFSKDSSDSCSFFISKKICGKIIAQKIVKELLDKGRTSEPYIFVSPKTQKNFRAFLELKNGKISFSFNTGITCPVCNAEATMNSKALSCPNKHKTVWFSNYGESKEKTWKQVCKEFTE